MTVTIVKHSFYKIEIDTHEAPQQPIVYFRKEGKCTTAKGMDRQHNRIVNETVEAVPVDVVVQGEIRKA